MMTLPLKKVWGIGKKTLERLHKAGFYTTKQIFEKQKELLKIEENIRRANERLNERIREARSSQNN